MHFREPTSLSNTSMSLNSYRILKHHGQLDFTTGKLLKLNYFVLSRSNLKINTRNMFLMQFTRNACMCWVVAPVLLCIVQPDSNMCFSGLYQYSGVMGMIEESALTLETQNNQTECSHWVMRGTFATEELRPKWNKDISLLPGHALSWVALLSAAVR